MANEKSFETLTPPRGMPRFPALDGWRGVSILLVLAGHLLPLGPKTLQLNATVPALGMAIFFTLSGFLITSTLLFNPSVVEFLIRRFCRIVPLAWLYMIITLACIGASAAVFRAHLLFYGNLPPFWLNGYTAHLWSLCVEMQFYVFIGGVCLLFGRRGLWVIPVVCFLVTAHRVQTHTLISIVTTLRADEILAGGTLALVCNTEHLSWLRRFLAWIHPLAVAPFALVACSERLGAVDYLRPYCVAALVGSTLLSRGKLPWAGWLQSKWLAYLAATSYALYVLHPMCTWGWLSSGPTKAVIYFKRLPALAGVFALAHLSTFYYEHFWIGLGKKWCRKLRARKAAGAGNRRFDAETTA